MLLARADEDEAADAIPDAVRHAMRTAEPQATVMVYDVEHEEPVVREADCLRGNEQPLVQRLILVRFANRGRTPVRNQFETEFARSIVGVLELGALGEPKIGIGSDHEIKLGSDVAPVSTVEHAARPVANPTACLLEHPARALSKGVIAPLNGHPVLELRQKPKRLLVDLPLRKCAHLDGAHQIGEIASMERSQMLRGRLLLADNCECVRRLSKHRIGAHSILLLSATPVG